MLEYITTTTTKEKERNRNNKKKMVISYCPYPLLTPPPSQCWKNEIKNQAKHICHVQPANVSCLFSESFYKKKIYIKALTLDHDI